VVLRWASLVEFEVLGYRVERQLGDGSWTSVAVGIAPAAGSGSAYQVSDGVATGSGTIAYRLLKVGLCGETTVLAETIVTRAPSLSVNRTQAGIAIRLTGRASSTVTVEATPNPARGPWLRLESLTLDNSGTATFPLPTNGPESTHFYRACEE